MIRFEIYAFSDFFSPMIRIREMHKMIEKMVKILTDKKFSSIRSFIYIVVGNTMIIIRDDFIITSLKNCRIFICRYFFIYEHL